VTRIVVLVDDNKYLENLVARRGLSIYVEARETYLLFDLGPNSNVLQYNADKLNINLDLIDAAIISHIHSDHIGGLNLLGWSSPFLKVYIPYDSMEDIGRMVRNNGLVPVEVIDWINPWPHIYITKPIHGPPWEHFLVIRDKRGLIILSGCMHPGVDKVLSIIKNYFRDEKILGVIGGFHLENAPEKIVRASIDALMNKYEVEKVIPLHCSGNLFRNILVKEYPDRVVIGGVGLEYNF
jgi:7,8-dihydropterin-6-yl-methyl-4-(beta-D-ribofuranosyl)aminobenzene 5'-phosphate synthase